MGCARLRRYRREQCSISQQGNGNRSKRSNQACRSAAAKTLATGIFHRSRDASQRVKPTQREIDIVTCRDVPFSYVCMRSSISGTGVSLLAVYRDLSAISDVKGDKRMARGKIQSVPRRWLPRRTRLLIKDFIGPTISIVALVVSLCSLWLTYRTIEDFSISIGSDLPIPNPTEDNELIIHGPKWITFINSGNRSIAVMNVNLSVLQTKELQPSTKDCTDSVHVHVAIEPFVAKPGEVLIKAASIGYGLKVNDRGDPLIPRQEGMRRVLWCMVFDLITTDSVPERVYVPMISAEFETQPYGSGDVFFNHSKPIRLLPRS